ncbi:MAG TPA: ATP-binding protein [Ktedonobacterales bacterium]|nr:ATP-binding protein [Ktedonobacterales bacterium]
MLKGGWHLRLSTKGLRSLRAKFVLGYTLVALFAIAAISLAAVISVVVNFSRFQNDQLSVQASDLASQLGKAYTVNGGDWHKAAFSVLPGAKDRPLSTLWLIDNQQQIILRPLQFEGDTQNSQTTSIIQSALVNALKGQEVRGTLPSTRSAYLGLNLEARPFVAEPIRADGQASGKIVGALAVQAVALRPGTPLFTDSIVQVLLLTVLGTAVVVALLGMLISRGVTRPLAQLTRAASSMAAGEYSQRVPVRTKDEVGRLAVAFNEMAAALEQDVGELRRQEALRREMAANVSHDLATPLTAIQGFTEALLDGVIEDEHQREETLRVIAKEVVRLRRLVDDLGHLSRVESPRLLLDLAPTNLVTLVDETLAVLQPEFEAQSITARNLLGQQTPLALADADKLTQVLLNLLDNALRYTPTGGEITISAAVETGRVRVMVSDTGAGIAPEHIKRIFDRFYRADASRNAATGGSGLGLAIVKAIIEAHGGAVGIDSTPGKGTTVWFTLAQAQ